MRPGPDARALAGWLVFLAVGVALLLAGGFLGREAQRSNDILAQQQSEAALRARSDCILLHGRENCP